MNIAIQMALQHFDETVRQMETINEVSRLLFLSRSLPLYFFHLILKILKINQNASTAEMTKKQRSINEQKKIDDTNRKATKIKRAGFNLKFD